MREREREREREELWHKVLFYSGEECDLVISADEGKVVNYTFEFMLTEDRHQDCYDHLQVLNGKYTFTSSSRKFIYFVLGAADEMYLGCWKVKFQSISFRVYCGFHYKLLKSCSLEDNEYNVHCH